MRGGHVRLVNDFNPRSAVDAQFSLPFVVAMAVTREPLGPGMFSEARLFDPVVRDLLGRIALDQDAEAEALFFNEQRLRFSVAITLKSGASVQREIEFPRDQKRLGWTGVETKFRTLAGSLLPAAQVERAISTVRALDRLETLAPLIESVCAASGPGPFPIGP